MELSNLDLELVEVLCDGLPLVPAPYAELGRKVGMDEAEVLERLGRLIDGGVIKRFGVIVQHRKLGYTANGMSVWNIPDERVRDVGEQMSAFSFVTLCYQRPRHLPHWPYNLFAMVHGSSRDTVLNQVNDLVQSLALGDVERDVLFSSRQFKQCGANYVNRGRVDDEPCRPG